MASVDNKKAAFDSKDTASETTDTDSEGKETTDTDSDSKTTTATACEVYQHREITSLSELQPGDHIQVPEKVTQPKKWSLGLSSSSSSSGRSHFKRKKAVSTDLSSAVHHMLVVRVLNPEKVLVIHKTVDGVKKEVKSLDAKEVTVVEYECEFSGEEAIENAEKCHGDEYDRVNSNDEHFVTKAKIGTAFSSKNNGIVEWRVNYSPRKIKSVHELSPGDHIRVNGSMRLRDMIRGSSRSSNDPKKWAAYTHHMMVVKVLESDQILVIHKTDTGVNEKAVSHRSKDITVLDYESKYNGEEAIAKGRDLYGEEYSVLTSNCEHFVTEARTGRKSCGQLKKAFMGGVIGGGVGVPIGGAGGGIGGAITGAIVGGMFFPPFGALPGAVAGGLVGGVAGGLGGGGVGVAGGGFGGLKLANKTLHKKTKLKLLK